MKILYSRRLNKFILLAFFSFWYMTVPAQEHQHSHDDGQDHTEQTVQDSTAESHDSAHQNQSTGTNEDLLPEESSIPGTEDSVFKNYDEFPTLHPLFVHFPFVMLLLAFFTQLAGFFYQRRVMSWVTLFLLAGGFIGGLLAAFVYHPHVGDLPERVNRMFETHEHYAYYTLWLSGAALLFKAFSHFFMKLKTWAEVIVLVLVLSSGITVSLAGHLGTQLAYIESIGPQGKHLEEEHEH